MNEMVRRTQRSAPSTQDPIKQIFERLFEGNFGNGSTDESAVVTSQWVPRVDIKEESDRFVIYADLPGVAPQDIEVQMDKGVLTIKGERSIESAQDSDRYSRVERRHGSFHRRFALPDSADPDGIAVAAGDQAAPDPGWHHARRVTAAAIANDAPACPGRSFCRRTPSRRLPA